MIILHDAFVFHPYKIEVASDSYLHDLNQLPTPFKEFLDLIVSALDAASKKVKFQYGSAVKVRVTNNREGVIDGIYLHIGDNGNVAFNMTKGTSGTSVAGVIRAYNTGSFRPTFEIKPSSDAAVLKTVKTEVPKRILAGVEAIRDYAQGFTSYLKAGGSPD